MVERIRILDARTVVTTMERHPPEAHQPWGATAYISRAQQAYTMRRAEQLAGLDYQSRVAIAAHANGRPVSVTLRPALERATADLTRAQAVLTRAQAVLTRAQAALEDAHARHAAAELAPATVWIGTAQFDPNPGGGVTIVDATRIAGEPPAPGWAEEGNAADKVPSP